MMALQWFTKAGFEDVKIKRIGPKWYRGVRRHGLIMGCSVTGVKPKVHHGATPVTEMESDAAQCGNIHRLPRLHRGGIAMSRE